MNIEFMISKNTSNSLLARSKRRNTKPMTPKEKAKELITHYHNLIQDIGGELGQEILVSILARHCALFAAREVIKRKWHETEDFNDDILLLGRSRTRNRKL
jgi:hypothetical protein